MNGLAINLWTLTENFWTTCQCRVYVSGTEKSAEIRQWRRDCLFINWHWTGILLHSMEIYTVACIERWTCSLLSVLTRTPHIIGYKIPIGIRPIYRIQLWASLEILARFLWVPSIMFHVCMSVCLSYETPCRAGSYVCAHCALLRICLAEEYQLVRNKQAGKQQRMFSSCVLITIS